MNGDQLPKKGMGCFAQGCLALAIAFVGFVVVGGVGGWWMYNKTVKAFTSDRPAALQVDEPTDAAVQHAEGMLNQLRSAISNRTETSIAFSANDLNALIARDPAFAGLRGKARVNMSGNDMILDLSAPLDSAALRGLKGRWFNGRAQFGVNYNGGDFSFNARSLEANGHRIQRGGGSSMVTSFLQSFSSSFSQSCNQALHKGQESNPNGRAFWQQIKSMSVQNDQLLVVTRAGG